MRRHQESRQFWIQHDKSWLLYQIWVLKFTNGTVFWFIFYKTNCLKLQNKLGNIIWARKRTSLLFLNFASSWKDDVVHQWWWKSLIVLFWILIPNHRVKLFFLSNQIQPPKILKIADCVRVITIWENALNLKGWVNKKGVNLMLILKSPNIKV